MKTTSIISAVLASAAVASAQVKYEDGKYICETPDAAYCAGDSLGTDIIIRCTGTSGQPGRCSNNLAGQPPLGASPALCYQSSPTSGDAACEKNCVVYAADKTFTLPAAICTPTYTASTSAASTSAATPASSVPVVTEDTTLTTTICPESTSTAEPEPTVTEETTLTTTICPEESSTSTISISSITEPEPTVTEETTILTTICPESESLSLTTLSTKTLSPPPYSLNTTITYIHPTGSYSQTTGGSGPSNSLPTHTPTGPSGPGTSVIAPGAANANKAAGALAVLGAVAAFLL